MKQWNGPRGPYCQWAMETLDTPTNLMTFAWYKQNAMGAQQRMKNKTWTPNKPGWRLAPPSRNILTGPQRRTLATRCTRRNFKLMQTMKISLLEELVRCMRWTIVTLNFLFFIQFIPPATGSKSNPNNILRPNFLWIGPNPIQCRVWNLSNQNLKFQFDLVARVFHHVIPSSFCASLRHIAIISHLLYFTNY